MGRRGERAIQRQREAAAGEHEGEAAPRGDGIAGGGRYQRGSTGGERVWIGLDGEGAAEVHVTVVSCQHRVVRCGDGVLAPRASPLGPCAPPPPPACSTHSLHHALHALYTLHATLHALYDPRAPRHVLTTDN